MSLIGLFTLLGAQAESLQIVSSLPQGEGESLSESEFLNELMALLADNGDQGDDLSGQQAIEQDSNSVAPPGEEGLTLPQETPQTVTAPAQAMQASGGSGVPVAASGEPLNGDQAVRAPSAQEPSRNTTLSAFIGTSVTSQSSTQSPVQGAASASLDGAVSEAPADGEKAPNEMSASKLPLVGKAVRSDSSVPALEPPKNGVKAAHPPSGRQAENLSEGEAPARPFDAKGKGPHELQRLIQSVQQPSVQAQATARSAIPALDFRSAQLVAWRPVTETRIAPVQDDQPPSVGIRSAADNAPRVEKESSPQPGSDFDSSPQRHATHRSGAASASQASSFQSAASGGRFADLVQAQTPPVQTGLPASEGQPAKAMPPLAGESVLAEAAALRGQEADQVFAQIVQNARLLRIQGETRFEVRLKPEFLGKIQIQTLINADQRMTARFVVEDPEVRALLESRLPLLAERLGESGLRIAALEVQSMNSQNGGDASRSAGESGGQSRQQQQSSGRAGSDSPQSEGNPEVSTPSRPSATRPGGIHLVA